MNWELCPKEGKLDSPWPDTVQVKLGGVTRRVPAKWIGSILKDNSCFIQLSRTTSQTLQWTALRRNASHGVDLSHLGQPDIVFLHKCWADCAYLSVDLAAWDLKNWHLMKSEWRVMFLCITLCIILMQKAGWHIPLFRSFSVFFNALRISLNFFETFELIELIFF